MIFEMKKTSQFIACGSGSSGWIFPTQFELTSITRRILALIQKTSSMMTTPPVAGSPADCVKILIPQKR